MHQPFLIEGNDPPDYSAVTSLMVQNYVSRIYIDLLGEQPLLNSLQQKAEYLQNNDLNVASRKFLIQDISTDSAYFSNLFNYTSGQFLNGIGYNEIQEQISIYTFVIDLYYSQGEVQLAQIVEYELEKMALLSSAQNDFQNGIINVNEFYRRFCFNTIYDEINMGSDNFVIACFENLFGRYPTQNELVAGVNMVDGLSSVIFQQSGNSKAEFITILTETPEFYLGRVFEQYQRLLSREPSPPEEQTGTEILQSDGLAAFQETILISDEYADF